MRNYNGFITLVRRETYRFARLFRQTIVPPIISALMHVLIFGYTLGASIKQIHGIDYIVYILPGLAQLGVINNAYANTSTSVFMARLERSIENLVIAPLHYSEIVFALTIGGVLRGLCVGVTTYVVCGLFVTIPLPNIPLLIFVWIITSVLFSALGFISALLAENWDHIALFTNFVITPFVYLGGTFFSAANLSSTWQKVMHVNPVFYCIDAARMASIHVSDMSITLSLGVMSVLATMSLYFCFYLLKRGYKIIS